jgi:hypothetical protein
MDETDDARTSVVRAALRSHGWRSLPAEEVARVLIAARDRHRIEVLLGDVVGTSDGGWQALSPVDPDDIRVAPLTEFLSGRRPWREMSLRALVPELLDVLDRWWFRWQWRLGDETAPADDA